MDWLQVFQTLEDVPDLTLYAMTSDPLKDFVCVRSLLAIQEKLRMYSRNAGHEMMRRYFVEVATLWNGSDS